MSKKLLKKHKKNQEVNFHQKDTIFNIIKREMIRDKIALCSFIFIAIVIVFLIITAFIIDQDEILRLDVVSEALDRDDFTLEGFVQARARAGQAPSWRHWLGTDAYGRDSFMMLMIAARNTLTFTILATIFSSVFGIIYGLISGYIGGFIDGLMMRIIEQKVQVKAIFLKNIYSEIHYHHS